MQPDDFKTHFDQNKTLKDISPEVFLDEKYYDLLDHFLNENNQYKYQISKEDALHALNNISYTFSKEDCVHSFIMHLILWAEITHDELPNKYKENINLIYLAGIHDVEQVKHHQVLFNNSSYIASYLEKNPETFLYASKKNQKDEKFISFCLSKNGAILQYLPDHYKKSEKHANIALRLKLYSQSLTNWQYLHPELQHNLDYIKRCLSQCPDLFKHLDTIYHDNDECAKIAVAKEPRIFLNVSNRLKNNLDLASLACLTKPYFFEAISKELRNNITFVKPILKKFPSLIFHCGKKVKNNIPIAKSICSHFSLDDSIPCIFSCLSKELQNNPDIALQAVSADFRSFGHISNELLNNQEFLWSYLSSPNFNFKSLEHARLETLSNENIMITIFEKAPYAIKHIDNKLKTNIDFLEKILKINHDLDRDPIDLKDIPFDQGDELALLYFLNNSELIQYYDPTNPKEFNNIMSRKLKSKYFNKIIDGDTDFYFYLKSFSLSHDLEYQLSNKIKTKQPKI